MPVLIAFFAILSISTLIMGLKVRRELLQVRHRVEALLLADLLAFQARQRRQQPSLDEEQLAKPFLVRVIAPALAKVDALVRKLTPQGIIKNLQAKLQAAGYLGYIRPTHILASKLFLMVLFIFGTHFFLRHYILLTSWRALAALGLMAFLGFILPDFMLQQKINERQKKIRRSLPDILDLLIVSVEAGTGFDGAIAKVVEKTTGPLSDEFARVLHEMQLGKSRVDALRDMAERCKVFELSTFIAALYQAEQLGVSIAKVLRIQAEQLRLARSQRAREEAAKLPIKMLVPLVFFVFPAIFVVIGGPAAISILKVFGLLGKTGGVP
ncbi:MAG: type II secretion system F family protein [Candidatus Aenigmatarchaeota archaeon]